MAAYLRIPLRPEVPQKLSNSHASILFVLLSEAV